MEFRWVALITLWTLLVGPVFDAPTAATSRPVSRATVRVGKAPPAAPAVPPSPSRR